MKVLIVLAAVLVVIFAKDFNRNDIKNKSQFDTQQKNPSKRSNIHYHGSGFLPEPYSSYYGYQIPQHYSGLKYLSRPLELEPGAGVHYAHQSHLGSHLHFGAPAFAAGGVPFAASPTPAFSLPAAPTQYAIRPGGAVVSSYNVNYPQYHYQKAYPAVAPVAPVGPAVFAPPPVAVGPPHFIPSGFQYNRPQTIPFGPTFAPGFAIAQHVPAVIPQPIPATPVAPVAPPTHFFVPSARPTFGFQFAAAPQRPIFVFGPPPSTPVHPTSVHPTPTTGPNVIPIASGSGILPGQIPSHTTFVTPGTSTTPATPWRPIIINHPPTTAVPSPSVSGNRPAVSLLPPYGRQTADLEEFELAHYYNSQGTEQIQEQSKGYHY